MDSLDYIIGFCSTSISKASFYLFKVGISVFVPEIYAVTCICFYAAIDGVSVVFYTDYMEPVPQDFYFCYKIIVQGNFSLWGKVLKWTNVLILLWHFSLYWYPYYLNSSGAKNVINACRECKVKRLIYNSSAEVIFDDVRDIRGGDESLPYSGQVCVWLKFWVYFLFYMPYDF